MQGEGVLLFISYLSPACRGPGGSQVLYKHQATQSLYLQQQS